MSTWHDRAPVYRQIKDRILVQILEGGLADGDLVPSVRQMASDMQVNPLTVARAHQELIEEGVLVKNRGQNTTVATGAGAQVLGQERTRFFSEEWPRIAARIARLGIDPHTLSFSSEIRS